MTTALRAAEGPPAGQGAQHGEEAPFNTPSGQVAVRVEPEMLAEDSGARVLKSVTEGVNAGAAKAKMARHASSAADCIVSAHADLAATSSRRRLSPLARDIVVILAVKAVVLGILWYAFFRAPAAPQMTMDPLRVEQKVLGPSPLPESPDALR